MKYSIWKILDKKGNFLGLLKTESILDIMDVIIRAKYKFGKESDYSCPIYVGDIN